MNQKTSLAIFTALLIIFYSGIPINVYAQVKASEKFKNSSRKVEKGLERYNRDTLAQGYFDMGSNYYQNGEIVKCEQSYQKSKNIYEKLGNAEGIAKSSRALAKVQEEMHKDKEALNNYVTAQKHSMITGDTNSNALNRNDISRLSKPGSVVFQQGVLQDNINLGLKYNDSIEIVSNYTRMAEMELQVNEQNNAVGSYSNAYRYSKNNPPLALRYNQLITDVYLKEKNYDKAIEAKKEILNEGFVQNSTKIKASEITSLADIYIQKKDDITATRLLNESYELSVANGHTLEAKKCIEKLDSIFQNNGQKQKTLELYKTFLSQLPSIIMKDSSLTDNKIIGETEEKLKKLESERAIKNDLIRKKNVLNYWLIVSIIVLVMSLGAILVILNKLKIKNKKIALQSLRREMNPHFIFNSLNSINQFIANNDEIEANQYLTKFSTLMRSVMENSKEDFVLFTKEIELLQNYLELEKSRFPDKFDFSIHMDDSLHNDEHLKIPGMLIQPHLENAIWHGLRYMDEKGFLKLSFTKKLQTILIVIEDNGIGIAQSKKSKTVNQEKHTGRGISNTLERIKILNDLYHQNITCIVEDKRGPDHGVMVKLTVPIFKNGKNED